MTRKDIPKFQSEAEEAEWWDAHREETAEWMEEAVDAGQATSLTAVLHRNRERVTVPPTVSIPIDPTDVNRARSQAARKGLGYQSYLRMLLHEALDREERAG